MLAEIGFVDIEVGDTVDRFEGVPAARPTLERSRSAATPSWPANPEAGGDGMVGDQASELDGADAGPDD